MPIAIKVAVNICELDHVETLVPDQLFLASLFIKFPHHTSPIDFKSQEVLLDELFVPRVVQSLLH